MKNYKYYLSNVVTPVLVYGSLTGLLVGTAVFFFKLVAEWLMEKSKTVYLFVQQNPWWIFALVGGALALAFLSSALQRWCKECKGGGIPRAEGVLRGLLTFRWLRTAIAVVVNSFISFFAGLPLGSEGPSVLLGTAIGGGTSKLPLSHDSWNRYIMTGGACAGFAVATGAPVTGLLFGLEETHKRFTPMLFLMCASSVIFGVAASEVWSLVLGVTPQPLFNFSAYLAPFSLADVWIPLVVGLVVALVACGFNALLFFMGKAYDTKLKKVPQWARLVVVFLLAVAVGVLKVGNFNGADALYGGGGLIEELAQSGATAEKFSWSVVFALFCVRFVTIAFATSSGATGGMFIPMLSIGALLGALVAEILVSLGVSTDLYATIVLLSMVAFMGAATRSPLTALVFTVECTWSFTSLFYVAVAVFVSYLICEIFKVEPLYDVLLQRMVEKHNQGKPHKILKLRYVVAPDAFAVSKSVRDVLWPANTKVSQIVADDNVKRMDDDGEKKICAGDIVTIYVQTYDEEGTLRELEQILGKQDCAHVRVKYDAAESEAFLLSDKTQK